MVTLIVRFVVPYEIVMVILPALVNFTSGVEYDLFFTTLTAEANVKLLPDRSLTFTVTVVDFDPTEGMTTWSDLPTLLVALVLELRIVSFVAPFVDFVVWK